MKRLGDLVAALAFGDLNRDGTADLVAINSCDLFGSSCGGNVAVFLNNPVQALTSSLSVSSNLAAVRQAVLLTDTVNNPGNLLIGPGSITFYDGTTILSTISVPAFQGSASFSASWTPTKTGARSLASVYSANGGTNNAPEGSTAFVAEAVGIAVPNVVGSTQATAAATIAAAGLLVGAVSQQSSTSIAAGSVISESPVAGTAVSAGSAVSLLISSGAGTYSQTITFGPAPSVLVGGAGTVSATASSGLPVVFGTTTPAICTVSGSMVSGVAVGECIVTADQAGNVQYPPAAEVTQSVPVGSVQTITLSQYPTSMLTTATATLAATASSGLPVTFGTTSPASICTRSAAPL